MDPLFLGSHPAMDFLNTTFSPQGAPVELIGDGASFLEWLVSAGLLDRSTAAALKRRPGESTLDAVAAEARRLRTWATGWISRWRAAADDDYEVELRRLNSLLERAKRRLEVVRADAGLRLCEHSRIDSADALIALVAEQIALLVTAEQPSLVKRCAGSGCTLWFLDRTRAHRRLFCSAEVCGNRAKVAAFRGRRRRRAGRLDQPP
jgi:predicted RNA-binding Zn ribbon-like protein